MDNIDYALSNPTLENSSQVMRMCYYTHHMLKYNLFSFNSTTQLLNRSLSLLDDNFEQILKITSPKNFTVLYLSLLSELVYMRSEKDNASITENCLFRCKTDSKLNKMLFEEDHGSKVDRLRVEIFRMFIDHKSMLNNTVEKLEKTTDSSQDSFDMGGAYFHIGDAKKSCWHFSEAMKKETDVFKNISMMTLCWNALSDAGDSSANEIARQLLDLNELVSSFLPKELFQFPIFYEISKAYRSINCTEEAINLENSLIISILKANSGVFPPNDRYNIHILVDLLISKNHLELSPYFLTYSREIITSLMEECQFISGLTLHNQTDTCRNLTILLHLIGKLKLYVGNFSESAKYFSQFLELHERFKATPADTKCILFTCFFLMLSGTLCDLKHFIYIAHFITSHDSHFIFEKNYCDLQSLDICCLISIFIAMMFLLIITLKYIWPKLHSFYCCHLLLSHNYVYKTIIIFSVGILFHVSYFFLDVGIL